MRSLVSASNLVLLPLALGLCITACGADEGSPAAPTEQDGGPGPSDDVPVPTPTGDAGTTPTPAKDASTGPSCTEQLTALGVKWEPTAARGVVDAVHVKDRINGVLFALEETTNPAGDPMACEFVLTLHKFAGYLKTKGVDHVGTLGSYCYRCCCAWSSTNFCRGLNDPEPSCGANGYSNHSWGRAIDIRYVYTTAGKRYDINNPKTFVMSTADTCTAAEAKQTGDSKFLYDLVCGAASAQVFSTLLTPNFNAAHRNHFHLDIGKDGPPKGFTVQSANLRIDTADGTNNSCADE
jgi:hypothetical protein